MNLTLSETPKSGFVATWAKLYWQAKGYGNTDDLFFPNKMKALTQIIKVTSKDSCKHQH